MEERRLLSILAHLNPRPPNLHIRKLKGDDCLNSMFIFDDSRYGAFPDREPLHSHLFSCGSLEQNQPQRHIFELLRAKCKDFSSSEPEFRHTSNRDDISLRLPVGSSELGMELCRGLDSLGRETSDEMIKKDIKEYHVQTDYEASAKQRCPDQSSLGTSCSNAAYTRFCSGNKDDSPSTETDQGGGKKSIEMLNTSENQSLGEQDGSNEEGKTTSVQYQDGRNMDKFQKIESQLLERMSICRNNAMTGERRLFKDDCIFCSIAQGQSPAFKLYEDDVCVCFLDMHPLTHGHSLLIPKGHFPTLELTPPEVAATMCATVPLLSTAIMRATKCDAFNLLVNTGKAAGQVIFHTHFHIIPRRAGDNLWRSEGVRRRLLAVDHETSLLAQRIRCNIQDNK